jgi:acyl-CoA dehydrogenase
MAEAMLLMTIKYTKERMIFGKPKSSFQHNTFKIVEMETEIEIGRRFLNFLIADYIIGHDIVMKVSMAKAWIPEMVDRAISHCVQLYEGYGYNEEYPICQLAKDPPYLPEPQRS